MYRNGWAASLSTERFEEANRLYEEEDYPAALDIYHEIEKNGAHWKLYYNIGNCYYKVNELVRAKIYYLKARRLEPFEPSIGKNIEIVNKRLNEKITPPKPDFIARLVMRIESIVSLDVLSVLLVLVILLFNVFLFLLIKKGKQRLLVYGVSFSLVFLLLLAGYHMYRVNKFNQRTVAVITAKKAHLRSGPGENNTILFKVNPGLQVKIIDSSSNGQWLQVSASPEVAGWIEAGHLERI
jgi:tetratricopeptide (TPR) repeat protein